MKTKYTFIRHARIEEIGQLIDLWQETDLYFKPFDSKKRLEEKIRAEQDLVIVE